MEHIKNIRFKSETFFLTFKSLNIQTYERKAKKNHKSFKEASTSCTIHEGFSLFFKYKKKSKKAQQLKEKPNSPFCLGKKKKFFQKKNLNVGFTLWYDFFFLFFIFVTVKSFKITKKNKKIFKVRFLPYCTFFFAMLLSF